MSDIDDLFSGGIPSSKKFDPEAAKQQALPPSPPTPDKPKTGRPRKKDKLIRVDTRLSQSDIEKIRTLAEKTGHSESGMLRELILLGLRSKNVR